jgi:hypothetical protein
MRDYGKISPQFWIGRTGKALRGNAEAQVLALYLMTSPHANMIGVYHCPVVYMAHETGLTFEGASKALQSLIEADFCTFDAEDEYVFVHQFALHQVGESLAPSDNRSKGVMNELAKVPKNQCWQAFRARYAEPYSLPIGGENAGFDEAPSKPLASQKQKQEQKIGGKPPVASPDESGRSTSPAASLPTCPVDQVVELYHEVLPELPRCRLMPDARRKAISRRWRWVLTSHKADGTRRAESAKAALGWFRLYFEQARGSDFLMGRTTRSAGHEGWQCDLDFLMGDKGLKTVVEKTEVAA